MNYKKQLDSEGQPLSAEKAVILSKEYCTWIKSLKNQMIEGHDYGVNTAAWDFLNEVKKKILKFKILNDEGKI